MATTFKNITMTRVGTYNSSGVKIYTGTVLMSLDNHLELRCSKTNNHMQIKPFPLHGY